MDNHVVGPNPFNMRVFNLKKKQKWGEKSAQRSSPEEQEACEQPKSCWKGWAGSLGGIVALIGKENKEI